MPIENEPALVRFDAGAAVELARERAGEDLLVAGEFTPDGFNLIYMSDVIIDAYGDEASAWDAAKAIHGYIHLDFEERRLMEDIYPPVEETYAFVMRTDVGWMARVFAEDEGIYLTFRPGTEVSGIVDEVAEVVREG